MAHLARARRARQVVGAGGSSNAALPPHATRAGGICRGLYRPVPLLLQGGGGLGVCASLLDLRRCGGGDWQAVRARLRASPVPTLACSTPPTLPGGEQHHCWRGVRPVPVRRRRAAAQALPCWHKVLPGPSHPHLCPRDRPVCLLGEGGLALQQRGRGTGGRHVPTARAAHSAHPPPTLCVPPRPANRAPRSFWACRTVCTTSPPMSRPPAARS